MFGRQLRNFRTGEQLALGVLPKISERGEKKRKKWNKVISIIVFKSLLERL